MAILASLLRPVLAPLIVLALILILGLTAWWRATSWRDDRDDQVRMVERLEVQLRDAREESRRLAGALEEAERLRIQKEALQRDQDGIRDRFRFAIDGIETNSESMRDQIEELGFPNPESSDVLRETIRRLQANRP